MESNQIKFSRREQGSVIQFLEAEMCKPWEIYRKMCDVYIEKACFSKKRIYTNVLSMSLPLWD